MYHYIEILSFPPKESDTQILCGVKKSTDTLAINNPFIVTCKNCKNKIEEILQKGVRKQIKNYKEQITNEAIEKRNPMEDPNDVANCLRVTAQIVGERKMRSILLPVIEAREGRILGMMEEQEKDAVGFFNWTMKEGNKYVNGMSPKELYIKYELYLKSK